MHQMKRSIYSVSVGEIVTVEVQATKTGNFVQLSFNSAKITPSSVDPPIFRFTIAGAVRGSDFAVVSCHFANEAPDDAGYQLFLTGSGGGGKFTGSDIVKASGVWDRDITFVSSEPEKRG